MAGGVIERIGSLRVGFLIALAVGISGIALGALLPSWYGSVATVAIPVSAMGAYWFVGTRLDRTNVATLQFADSLYYLGFLFTLVALAFSLPAARSGGVDLIITRFGVALVTTIVGLLGRIYLTNFRETFDESIGRTEEALAHAASDLRTRLEQVSQDMIGQNELMNTTLRQSVADTSKALRETVESIRDSMGRFNENLGTDTEELRASVSLLVDRLSSTADAIGRGTESVREQLASVEFPRDVLTEAVAPALTSLQDQLRVFERDFAAAEQSLTREAERVGRAVGEATDSIRQRVASIELPPTLLKDALSPALTSLREELTDFEREFAATVRALAKDTLQIGRTASAVQLLNGRVTSLSTTIERAQESLGNQAEIIEEQARRSREFGAETSAELERTRANRERLDRELSEAQTALSTMYQQLVAAANYIREDLRRS